MNHASFVHAHAADADWRVVLAECRQQLDTRMTASAAEQHVSAQFTLGWCYLSDYYASESAAILDVPALLRATASACGVHQVRRPYGPRSCRGHHTGPAGIVARTECPHDHRLSFRRSVLGAKPSAPLRRRCVQRRVVRRAVRARCRSDLTCDAGLPTCRAGAYHHPGRTQSGGHAGRQARARLRVAGSWARRGSVN